MPQLANTVPEPYWRSDCGNYEVWCGDCQVGRRRLSHVDGILTDPPYGIGFAAQPTKASRDTVGRQPETWDDEAPDVKRWLAFGCPMMVWGGNHFDLPVSRGWLVWAKPAGLPTYGDAELCWTNIEMPVRHLDCERCNGDKVDHPTQKPVRLIEWCLRFMPESKYILDMYMGSGTTGVACVNLGRGFVGIEREIKYCRIAVGRIQRAMLNKGLIHTTPVDEMMNTVPIKRIGTN